MVYLWLSLTYLVGLVGLLTYFCFSVYLSLGFLVFVYWPQEIYPNYMYGGNVERINGWAYVHE